MKQRGELDQRPFGNFGFPRESEILRAVEVTIVVHDDIIPWRYPAKRELQFENGSAMTFLQVSSSQPRSTLIWLSC